MRTCVFGKDFCSPGTMIYKSDNVLECAKALENLCIETIDDVRTKAPETVKKALTGMKGIGPATAHMFLVYCGRDDYVKGDVHVCQFVAKAVGVEKVTSMRCRGAGRGRRMSAQGNATRARRRDMDARRTAEPGK